MTSEEIKPYKRFLLFGYDSYYPSGAQGDVVDSFDSMDEARARMATKDADYYEVLDLQMRVWVWVS